MNIEELKEKLLKTAWFVDNIWLEKYCSLIKLNLTTKKETGKTAAHHVIPRVYFKEVYKVKTDFEMEHLPDYDNILVNLSHFDHLQAHCFLALATKPNSRPQYLLCSPISLILKDKSVMDSETLENFINSEDFKKFKEQWSTAISYNINRDAISNTLSKLRTDVGFSAEHKKRIKETREKRKIERAKLGLSFYDHPEHMASRSLKVYCIINNERYDFDSILEAGRWWYAQYKPFGEKYNVPTYQRKIQMSINTGKIKYRAFINGKYKYIEITNIKWFYTKKEGDNQ